MLKLLLFILVNHVNGKIFKIIFDRINPPPADLRQDNFCADGYIEFDFVPLHLCPFDPLVITFFSLTLGRSDV